MEDLPDPFPYRRGYPKESSAGAEYRQTLGYNRVMDDQSVTRRELAESLARHAPEEVTDAMNRLCAEIANTKDEFVSLAGRRILERTAW